eukprot:TRINITY_DN17055_c0_g1_i1.p1 TRINITY_DN17055_c0_g1~~TRINITY_DN17055_c0_g1_i1.p1  ORF type:complete len:173 (+),score=27.56 TRINITY_DN17055_c0_g1_i1:215-733(+)
MAGFFKRMFGKFSGSSSSKTACSEGVDDEHDDGREYFSGDADRDEALGETQAARKATGGGFKVQRAVRSEQPRHVPVVRETESGDGGIQGLSWYSERLKMDEDDDVADEFYNEVVTKTPDGASATKQKGCTPSLEAVLGWRLRSIRPCGPIQIADGNVLQSVLPVPRRPLPK